MNGNKTAVYTINVNGEERKAIDIIALKTYIIDQKLKFSTLSLDPKFISKDEPVIHYIASAAVDTIKELEELCDKILGIYKEPEPEPVQEEPEDEEPEDEEAPDLQKPETPKVIPKETRKNEMPRSKIDDIPEDEDDEIII